MKKLFGELNDFDINLENNKNDDNNINKVI